MPAECTIELERRTGRFVCHCLQVTNDEVREVVCKGLVSTLHDVRILTGAGAGCTACHYKLKQLISETSPANA